MSSSRESVSSPLHTENYISTALPKLGTGGYLDILRTFEKQNIPKNIENLLAALTRLIGSQFRYDALNYALMKEFPIESPQGGWIDKLSISDLSMSPEQVLLLIKTLGEYKKAYETNSRESTHIDLIILALRNRNFQEFVAILIEMPSLQKTILADEKFEKNWMQLYGKEGISALLQMGIGNCKTLAIMSQKILEIGNSRWNLGINKIEIIEGDDHHVTLKCYTKKGIIEYDPMESLYKTF